MGSALQQEKDDKPTNRAHEKSDLTKQQKWAGVFFTLNSCALYQTGMVIANYYFNDDRLPLSYHFFVGIVTSILAWLIEDTARNKTYKFKIWLAVIIMAGMVMSALFVPKR